jgi:cyclopropane-fatty-acyl-phospholipid synthase
VEAPEARRFEDLLRGGRYSLATAFLRGEFDVRGDLVAAVRRFREIARRKPVDRLSSRAAAYGLWKLGRFFQSRRRAAGNIRFHYDYPAGFYQQFLDERLVYSCAYFREPGCSLDQAQLAKFAHVCRKLDLRCGDRFLDVGCGWGGLVMYAAGQYGARAAGCTLSRAQYGFIQAELARRGLGDRVEVHEKDYRDLHGQYDKIASIGMFEHVGSRRLRSYFAKIYSLLVDDGRFLNHGIVRPQSAADDVETLFMHQYVFPDGELVHLADVVREAELAGFEVLDVENLRLHYAMTCRAWVQRLQEHSRECIRLVGSRTHRTWLLFLAASADGFERALLEVHQVLLAKRTSPLNRALTRESIYRG